MAFKYRMFAYCYDGCCLVPFPVSEFRMSHIL